MQKKNYGISVGIAMTLFSTTVDMMAANQPTGLDLVVDTGIKTSVAIVTEGIIKTFIINPFNLGRSPEDIKLAQLNLEKVQLEIELTKSRQEAENHDREHKIPLEEKILILNAQRIRKECTVVDLQKEKYEQDILTGNLNLVSTTIKDRTQNRKALIDSRNEAENQLKNEERNNPQNTCGISVLKKRIAELNNEIEQSYPDLSNLQKRYTEKSTMYNFELGELNKLQLNKLNEKQYSSKKEIEREKLEKKIELVEANFRLSKKRQNDIEKRLKFIVEEKSKKLTAIEADKAFQRNKEAQARTKKTREELTEIKQKESRLQQKFKRCKTVSEELEEQIDSLFEQLESLALAPEPATPLATENQAPLSFSSDGHLQIPAATGTPHAIAQ